MSTETSRPPGRLTVPVTAALTALVAGLAQLIVMAVWGARHSMGLREVLMQWDSQWMTLISEYGYSGFVMSPDQVEPVEWESVAFFPGYPVLVRIVAAPLAVLNAADATYVAALTVSAVASLVLAWGIALLALEMWRRLGAGEASHRTTVAVTVAAVVLTFGAPMSIVYWMPYSESLFTALTVWMLVAVLRRHHMLAGVLTLAAGLTRLTAVALILMLCAVAVVELWRWWARRRTDRAGRTGFPVASVLAPLIGGVGIIGYVTWANGAVSEIGGYFAAQDRGWHSGVDMGAATLRWLSGNLAGEMPGYVISSWSMILMAVLCLLSLWMLARGWVPWQVWLVAVLMAGIVLGSDGIMHSRPRLLLIPVLLLMLPLVLRLLQSVLGASRPRHGWRAYVLPGVLGASAVLWCALGFWVSGEMLIGFDYAI